MILSLVSASSMLQIATLDILTTRFDFTIKHHYFCNELYEMPGSYYLSFEQRLSASRLMT